MNENLRVIRQHHLELKNDYHRERNPQKDLVYTALVSACVGLICTNSTNPLPPPPRLDEVGVLLSLLDQVRDFKTDP